MKDLIEWLDENRVGVFPTKLPGMSEATHKVLSVIYYIDCETELNEIDVNVYLPGIEIESLKHGYAESVVIMTKAIGTINPFLLRCYANWVKYKIAFRTKHNPSEYADSKTGQCFLIRKRKIDNNLLF